MQQIRLNKCQSTKKKQRTNYQIMQICESKTFDCVPERLSRPLNTVQAGASSRYHTLPVVKFKNIARSIGRPKYV